MYWFGWKTPVLDGRPLAYHCQDLALWFDNVDLCLQATGGGDEARSSRDADEPRARRLRTDRQSATRRHPDLARRSPNASRAMMIWDATSEVMIDPDREARQALAQT